MSIKFSAIFVAAFVSLFFPIPVYPLIFFAFSFFVLIKTRPYLNLSDNRDRASLSVVAFVLIGVVVSWINQKPVWCDPGIKLVLNMMFLFSVLRWDRFLRNRQAIINMLAIAIVLSIFLTGIQVFVNVAMTNSWLDPFVGVSDSVEAYKIMAPGVYWGIDEKNIWATKIAFQSILILYMTSRNVVKVHIYIRVIVWLCVISSIVYTFSRTAQGVLFGFLVWEYYLRKVNLKDFLKKPLFVLASGAVFSLVGWKVYDKLFHLTLQPGDGMESRIRMWIYLWKDHDLIDFWLGKGYLYGREFLPTYEMVESNFHNVLINVLTDFGFAGLTIYASMYFWLSKFVDRSLLVYLGMVSMVQYSGYDNDIVVFIAVVVVLAGRINVKSTIEGSIGEGALV